MNKSKHTPGPWRIGDAGKTIFGPKSKNPSPETIAPCRTRANAARIVECVNALEGLDPGAIRELIEAASREIAANGNDHDTLNRLRAALAKIQEESK